MDNPNIIITESPKKPNRVLLFCLLAVVAVNLGLGIFFLYQYAGLKYFISAVIKVQMLSEPKKSKAIADFYNNQDGSRGYRGILAGVNKSGSGGIWIWGRAAENFRLGSLKRHSAGRRQPVSTEFIVASAPMLAL